jgi:phytoene dehydrogenase-like protein
MARASRGRSVRPVLVVGAGHNGLVCAVRLADAGVPVLVLEHAERPGGALTSVGDTLPGFVHDHCAGFLPLTLGSPAFEGLDVRERVQWANPPLAMAHPFRDGTAISLHRDLDATVASLEAASAGAGRAWADVVAPLIARREQVLRAALSPFPAVRPGLALALALRREGVELARRMLASTASLGRELFGSDRATAWLSGSAMHGDITPGAAGGAAFALFLNLLAHLVGWGFPRGGAGRLTDALVARLGELGGELRCGASVASIIVRDGRVAGVRLRGGEEILGDATVVTVSAGRLAAMLPPGALPDRLMLRLRTWRYGLGTFKVDYALSGPVPWTSPEAREAGVVHLADALPLIFRSHQQAGAGRAPSEPTLVVGQHTLHDPSRAPAGRHTLYVYTHVPQRLDVGDDEMVERIEARLEAFAPGFGALILARAVRSPQHLEAQNPSLVGGDLAGGSFELDQQFIYRPAPELFRGRTPLPGLYVAGASVHPGGGVHGVSGTSAARAVLADRSPIGSLRLRATRARSA